MARLRTKADWAVTVSAQDVSAVYALVLGRQPESEGTIQGNLHKELSQIFADLLGSLEFELSVFNPIRSRQRPEAAGFVDRPSEAMVNWLKSRPEFSRTTTNAAEAAEDWYGFYRVVFMDPFIAGINGARRLAQADFTAGLDWLADQNVSHDVIGEVEAVGGREITGWMIDRSELSRKLIGELSVDGLPIQRMPVRRFRREIQARYGGHGFAGFAFPITEDFTNGALVEIREASSRATIASFAYEAPSRPTIDDVAGIREDLRALRDAVARVEARLPDVERSACFALSDYPQYFVEHCSATSSSARRWTVTEKVTLVVEHWRVPDRRLGEVLRWVEGQLGALGEILITVEDGQSAAGVADLAKDVGNRWQRAIEVVSAATRSAAVRVAVGRAQCERIVLLDAAWGMPSFDGLMAMASAEATPGADIVFGDSDGFKGRNQDAHSNPRFRSAFDLELFLQWDDLGPLLRINRSVATELLAATDLAPDVTWFDLILRAHTAGKTIRHLPHLVAHEIAVKPPTAKARAHIVEHFPQPGNGLAAGEHADPVGTPVPDALRLRHKVPAGVSATLIVATRNGGSLLGPCLDSVNKAARFNATVLNIIVVDNGSDDPDTLDLLDAAIRSGAIEVRRAPGPFNWSLLNNAAAASAKGDVLIFLNDDTAVITPDWCDELVSQALRPHIGAVGARLLYGDNTIQHGGIVLGLKGFAVHEGVGQRVQEPGYLNRQRLVRQVGAVTGACLATRRDVFERMGGFDPIKFSVHGNDVEYCMRLTNAGLAVLYDPFVTLSHFESKTRGFNLDPEKRAMERRADNDLWEAWGSRDRRDPWYNPRFYRGAQPFTSLAPPGFFDPTPR